MIMHLKFFIKNFFIMKFSLITRVSIYIILFLLSLSNSFRVYDDYYVIKQQNKLFKFQLIDISLFFLFFFFFISTRNRIFVTKFCFLVFVI